MIKLFVGLGNPGAAYEDTRHNAGFWWIDALASQLKVSLLPDKNYHAKVARTELQGQTVWLLEPQTFMNLSGKSVSALARFLKFNRKKFWWHTTNLMCYQAKSNSSSVAVMPGTTACATSTPNWAQLTIGDCA